MSAPWVCERCGGPAWWTIIAGDVYYHCKVECEGFRPGQFELDMGLAPDYLDRVVSVSAPRTGRD